MPRLLGSKLRGSHKGSELGQQSRVQSRECGVCEDRKAMLEEVGMFVEFRSYSSVISREQSVNECMRIYQCDGLAVIERCRYRGTKIDPEHSPDYLMLSFDITHAKFGSRSEGGRRV